MELCAKFGKISRFGLFQDFSLDTSSPTAISEALYNQFWWDEYDITPVGEVLYVFVNSEGEENIGSYVFGAGGSVYDMEDNAILKNASGTTESSIKSILNTLFIPQLSPITFTPIDLSMKGLPYLEAGDYLAVVAEDGTIAYSFIMKQDITGIQILTASIESASGDIIESEEI